jgi:hypothetical protein
MRLRTLYCKLRIWQNVRHISAVSDMNSSWYIDYPDTWEFQSFFSVLPTKYPVCTQQEATFSSFPTASTFPYSILSFALTLHNLEIDTEMLQWFTNKETHRHILVKYPRLPSSDLFPSGFSKQNAVCIPSPPLPPTKEPYILNILI